MVKAKSPKTELHWEEPSYVLAPQFWQSVSARKHDAKGLLNARKQPACLDLGAPWKALKPFQSYATWKDHRVSYPVRYQLLPIWRNLGPTSSKASLLSWCFMSFIFHRLKPFESLHLWVGSYKEKLCSDDLRSICVAAKQHYSFPCLTLQLLKLEMCSRILQVKILERWQTVC